MSERIVFGFLASQDKVESLIGSSLDAAQLLRRCPEQVEELDGFLEEDHHDVDTVTLVQEILSGELQEEEARAYLYGRTLETLLTATGESLGSIDVVETYDFPDNHQGCWNPNLQRIGLSKFAQFWASNNFSFPWVPPGPGVVRRIAWPDLTIIGPEDLAELKEEFRDCRWRDKLRSLAAEHLSEDEDYADSAREEFAVGLVTVSQWIDRCLESTTTKKEATSPNGNSLVLIMDGSQ